MAAASGVLAERPGSWVCSQWTRSLSRGRAWSWRAAARRSGQLAAVVLFDRIQRRDPLERLGRDRRALRLVDIEELASHVRQARDLADGTGADESLEAGVAVGVHPAGEASQMLLGVMGLAVRGKPVPSRRRTIARPRPLVAYIAPGARRRRLAGSRGEYLDRGVIGEDGPTGQHVTPHRIGQRLEQRRRLADPPGQSRALQLHPVSGEDSALAVQREVVTVFRHEHVGEEPRSGPPALDRARRQRRLMEALAPSAGQPWANEPLDHEARRDVLQLLGDVLAQALQIGAAVGALMPWGENRLFTGKVFGQGATPR